MGGEGPGPRYVAGGRMVAAGVRGADGSGPSQDRCRPGRDGYFFPFLLFLAFLAFLLFLAMPVTCVSFSGGQRSVDRKASTYH